jgi:N-acylneuraminate cytidylyltransferase
MVSTDDHEIAEIAKSYGAKVPFMRSQRTADDLATTLDVLREVHDRYSDDGRIFAEACCLYATAPFVTCNILKKSYARFDASQFDSLFPVLPYSFPIQRALTMGKGSRISMIYPEHQTTRSQDLRPTYHDCGMFYWYRPNEVFKQQNLWTANSGAIILDPMQAQDIDTPEDWKVAEWKYQYSEGDRINS